VTAALIAALGAAVFLVGIYLKVAGLL